MEPEDFIARWTGSGQLALVGEFDSFCVPSFEAAIADRDVPNELVVDLSGLTFIDAGGLGVLVHLNRQRDAVGAPLILTGCPQGIRRLFAITQLDELLEIQSAPLPAT